MILNCPIFCYILSFYLISISIIMAIATHLLENILKIYKLIPHVYKFIICSTDLASQMIMSAEQIFAGQFRWVLLSHVDSYFIFFAHLQLNIQSLMWKFLCDFYCSKHIEPLCTKPSDEDIRLFICYSFWSCFHSVTELYSKLLLRGGVDQKH